MAKGFICSSTEPIVETKAGKLRGYCLNGIYRFLGVDYGTAERFEQPVPVQPWEGVKDATAFGYISYSLNPDSPNGDLMVPHRFWPKSEDCLNLNVWTPSVDKDAKKPVMVWIHGGMYSNGSSIEMVAYDGDHLSEYGDVVVVSINHRLNIFGHLNVSRFGEKYSNSQNAGIADLVLALQWVRDNIAAFGGDPDNVTIFGQSGGGNKITTLMQTPAADGLFHKAIVMSGSGGRPSSMRIQDNSDLTDDLLAYLGGDTIDTLLNLTPEELLAAAAKVNKRGIHAYGPCPNDWFTGWMHDGITDHNAEVPFMIGTCLAEFSGLGDVFAGRSSMSEEDKKAKLFERFGEENGTAMLETFCRLYPGHDALDLLALDDGFRTSTQILLDRRAEKAKAPTYNYIFAYEFPVDEGRPAWHCSDIPYVFRNMDKVAVCNEPGMGELMQERLSNAFISFARTGCPANEYLPDWNAYTADKPAVMIIDRESRICTESDRELVRIHREGKVEINHPEMLF